MSAAATVLVTGAGRGIGEATARRFADAGYLVGAYDLQPCAWAEGDDRFVTGALDVTDPEPLPDGHPLWELPNCLVTPHTANPWQTAQPLLAQRITDNVRRDLAGQPLTGLVDLDAGY